MVVRGPTQKLLNGAEMPVVGLGTWLSERNEVGEAVRVALECGYRLIDTAEIYENEEEIGDVLHEYFKSGKLKREEVFITTKLFVTHFRHEDIEPAIQDSLKKLQVDYVDLYLAHAPGAISDRGQDNSHITVEDIWKGLENVYSKGYAKAIGVSNFNIEQMERIRKVATIPIFNCQVECYLYFPQFELVDYCKKHNITFTAYGPIGSPGRFKCNVPGAGVDFKPAPNPLEDALVKQLSEKYHKTPAQILLRHLLQRDLMIIPKSVNEQRIKENWNIFDFELDESEVRQMNTPTHHQRLFYWDFLAGHPEDPFKSERN